MKQSVAILGSALLLATPLAADTNVVTTDPVGVMRYVFQADSDTAMSLPLHRPTEFAGAVGSVGSNWITAFATSNSPINWANNDWTYGVGTNANNTYYAMFTTGALEGAWFEITGNNSNTVFLDTTSSLVSLGVTASNSFEIIPFWTFASVFADSQSLVKSSDPLSVDAATKVLTPDRTTAGQELAPNGTFFCYDGSNPSWVGVIEAGWYPVGDPFTPKVDDDPILPDSYMIIRAPNTARTNFVTGAVTMNDFSTLVGNLQNNRSQDNFIGFGFPVDTTLADCGLQNVTGFPSSDPLAPGDTLLFFDQDTPGIEKAPNKVYFYYDGSNPAWIGVIAAGWYEYGDPFTAPLDDTVVIRAGTGVIIRRAARPAGATPWTATPAYASQ